MNQAHDGAQQTRVQQTAAQATAMMTPPGGPTGPASLTPDHIAAEGMERVPEYCHQTASLT